MLLESLNISKAKENQFKSKKIYSVEDMVYFLPLKYYDFRESSDFNRIANKEMVCLIGKIIKIQASSKMVKAVMKEEKTGKIFNVVWFSQPYMEKRLNEEFIKKRIICAGTVGINVQYNSIDICNPMIFSDNIEYYQKIVPVYSKIKGMSTEYFQNTMDAALSVVDKTDHISEKARKQFNLINKRDMIEWLHHPSEPKDITRAKKRLLFDDLYYFASEMEKNKSPEYESEVKIKKTEKLEEFKKLLPYEMTKDQTLAVEGILQKIEKGKQTSSLVNGDVGCGKTTVALALMIAIVENGYQAVLMAPTGVLAHQHYEELKEYADKLGFNTVYLSGDLKAKEKKEIYAGIKNGTYSLIVGTHSVVSDGVEYNNLGITIVDEEHRFGVIQKEKLNEKAAKGVHSIIMSATPIPRSQAMACYGENIDVYQIETMPAGRQPVQTAIASQDKTVYEFMAKQIAEGHQCYMVCPLIEENNDDDSEKEPMESVNFVYDKTVKYFKDNPNIKVGMVTGKMKKAEIDEEIGKFARNECQILISTTIIEVGVNVPNATLIVINNAERFGLTTLHQLRGRVGRGKYKSYCILKSKDKENERLQAMTETTNGFAIAEKDLKIRGAGDFIGTAQSGNNKYVMLMIAYPKLYSAIRKFIQEEKGA